MTRRSRKEWNDHHLIFVKTDTCFNSLSCLNPSVMAALAREPFEARNARLSHMACSIASTSVSSVSFLHRTFRSISCKVKACHCHSTVEWEMSTPVRDPLRDCSMPVLLFLASLPKYGVRPLWFVQQQNIWTAVCAAVTSCDQNALSPVRTVNLISDLRAVKGVSALATRQSKRFPNSGDLSAEPQRAMRLACVLAKSKTPAADI